DTVLAVNAVLPILRGRHPVDGALKNLLRPALKVQFPFGRASIDHGLDVLGRDGLAVLALGPLRTFGAGLALRPCRAFLATFTGGTGLTLQPIEERRLVALVASL